MLSIVAPDRPSNRENPSHVAIRDPDDRRILDVALSRLTLISDFTTWPRSHEFELREASDARKVTFVVRDEHASRLAAGQSQKNIVGERFRDTRGLQALGMSHLRKQIAGSVPRGGCWGNRPIRPREDPDEVLFQRLSILRTSNPSSQLLGNDDAEVFERREHTVEVLKCFVRAAVAKCLYEEVRVEDVLPRLARHRSASGDAMSSPSIARVPSISSR